MRVRVADYIADYLVKHGVNTVFTVIGGGAMHLNDAFGNNSKIKCIYQHHEQACGIAAEAYARVHNCVAVACVTSGPGAINVLNGVAGAYLDSIPMLVISGQTKTTLLASHTHLKLRSLGNQEFDVADTVTTMTKNCDLVEDPLMIKVVLERALELSQSGRPGPCWIDIPLDIQGRIIDTDRLYSCSINEEIPVDQKVDYEKIFDLLKKAERPILYAGNAIRISRGYDIFRKLVSKLKIPVVTGWNCIDVIPTCNEFYAGRAGTMGDRAGNFAVQNSDLILSLGSRLNIYQVGFNVKTWARKAYVIAVDIDRDELRKPTIRVDMPICCDIKSFMEEFESRAERLCDNNFYYKENWVKRCNEWKERYPVVQKRQYEDSDLCNVYAFIDTLSRNIPEGMNTVVANGSASVVGSQTYYIKENQRFIMNCALSSMGYDLPASIGACVADDNKPLICIAGDGSIQMNIQELQTIITNNLPIKIFIINNNGYHQCRLTQTNVFGKERFVGFGSESGGIGFPSFEKLAWAYGYKYFSCSNNSDLQRFVTESLDCQEPLIAEVFVYKLLVFVPKCDIFILIVGTLLSGYLVDFGLFL